MGLNNNFISYEDYIWVYENKDIFRKYLYDYFDFRGKNLTHWAIKISSPEPHYIKVTLHKAPKLNEINWMVFNCNVTTKRGTLTNIINTSHVNKYKSISRELNTIKEETKGNYFEDLMKIIKRDIKIINILDV